MARGESAAVLRDVQTLFGLGTIHGLTDKQLLDRFRSGSDEGAETAFAGLVARHGSMVLGVCRRALRDPNDVADAFQATFLVLVRKAETVQARDSLGRWLYGVSRRVAIRAKRTAARRAAREGGDIDALAARAPQNSHGDLPTILDDEIGRLPERYRAVVVLCDLEGLGQDEAARQLGCAVGTVKSRLSRGREKLRSRLIRRGVAPAAGILCGESIAAVVPAAMAEATVKAATRFAAGQAGVAGVASARVIELTQGVIQAMLFSKVRIILATAIALAALSTGVGVLARQPTAPASRGEQDADQTGSKAQDAAKTRGAVGTPPVDSGEDPSRGDDEEFERSISLRLDIELLESEINLIQQSISRASTSLVHKEIAPIDPSAPMSFVSGKDKEKYFAAIREQMTQDRDSLDKLRDRYLEKSKELRQKQRELETLPGHPIGSARAPRQPQPRSNARRTPSPGKKAAPTVEARLSKIERKLDEVMELLKESKR